MVVTYPVSFPFSGPIKFMVTLMPRTITGIIQMAVGASPFLGDNKSGQ